MKTYVYVNAQGVKTEVIHITDGYARKETHAYDKRDLCPICRKEKQDG